MTDHERLGVAENATREDLDRAFRKKKAELHPDVVNGRRRQQGLPPDPRADAEFQELVAAFERLAAAGNQGEVPDWAKDLIGRWGSTLDAAKRGDIPGALGELQGLALEVQGHGAQMYATAAHIHATVQDGLERARKMREGLAMIVQHFTRKK